MNEDVLRIVDILEFRREPEPLKKKHARQWFTSEDPNVIGAATDAVLRYSEYINPALSRMDVGEFLMRNFEVSLRAIGQKVSTYAYNCHEAAKEFYVWVIAAYRALPDPEARSGVDAAKEFLRTQYRNGEQKQKNCIVSGALEHLFEVDGLRDSFRDWKDDPDLRDAYAKAEEWASWVRGQKESLAAVTERAADLLRARGASDVVVEPSPIGTVGATLSWRDGEELELTLTCDETWTENARAVDVARAAKFAIDRSNWSQSEYVPTHFTVHLEGDKFVPHKG